MMGKTHFLAGAALAAAFSLGLEGAALAGFGALLPDVDCQKSSAGRALSLGGSRFAAGAVLAAFGLHTGQINLFAFGVVVLGASFLPHRGPTHSLLFALLAGAASPALGLGVVTHLLLDMASGTVPLLWPLRRRFGARLIRTGGIAEAAVFLPLLALAALAVRLK